MTDVPVPTASGDPQTVTFDLNNNKYFLLLALGGLAGDGHIAKHSNAKPSGDEVDLGNYGSVSEASHVLIILHAGEGTAYGRKLPADLCGLRLGIWPATLMFLFRCYDLGLGSLCQLWHFLCPLQQGHIPGTQHYINTEGFPPRPFLRIRLVVIRRPVASLKMSPTEIRYFKFA